MSSDAEARARDDGLPWGFMVQGVFVILSKGPLLRAGYGPPPFSVTMPDQSLRHVIHDPQRGTSALHRKPGRPMTEDERARIAALYNAGLMGLEIAEAVDRPMGTVQNVIYLLQHAGVLQKRLKSRKNPRGIVP